MPTLLYPPLRPQSIGEVLDSAFLIFKVTLLKCLPYGLLAMVASQLQSLYDVATGRPLGAGGVLWWLWFVVGVLASIVLWSGVILRQQAVLDRRPSAFGTHLAQGLRRLPAMASALVLALLAVGAGLLLLVLPGVYLAVALSLTWQAVLLSGKGPLEALHRSRRLVSGNALRVFTVFSVGLSMVLVFDLVMFTLVAVLLQFAGTGDLTVVTSYLPVVVVALGSVTAPFLCALALALYGDLEVRRAAGALSPTPEVLGGVATTAGADDAPAPGEQVVER